MDRSEALGELATAHAVALRLRHGGSSHEAIAEALGIPLDAVEQELAVAEAKLARLMADEAPGRGEPLPPS